jgi:hypothetical protein
VTVLDAAQQRWEEWRLLEAVVPSSRHQVQLRPELQDGTVTLDPSTWSALIAIGDGTSVGHLADALRVGPLEGRRRVRHLVETGVAVVTPPNDAVRHTRIVDAEPRRPVLVG